MTHTGQRPNTGEIGKKWRQRLREGRDVCERRRGERGSRARSADPTAPRYNVSGGGGGELKALGREIKTNTEMRGANGGWGWGREEGGPREAARAGGGVRWGVSVGREIGRWWRHTGERRDGRG